MKAVQWAVACQCRTRRTLGNLKRKRRCSNNNKNDMTLGKKSNLVKRRWVCKNIGAVNPECEQLREACVLLLPIHFVLGQGGHLDRNEK
jgi:hypothetical protein